MGDTAFFPIIGLGLIAAVTAVVLRQYRPEFAMLASLAAGVLILFGVLEWMKPIAEQITAIFDTASMPGSYVQVLFKALGICFIAQIACDACKDAGENAIGSKIEFAGKIAVLAVSLPLFGQVLGIVRSLLA